MPDVQGRDRALWTRGVVFALSGGQLQELKPPGAVSPDAVEVAYEGPALFAEARVPIDGYYA